MNSKDLETALGERLKKQLPTLKSDERDKIAKVVLKFVKRKELETSLRGYLNKKSGGEMDEVVKFAFDAVSTWKIDRGTVPPPSDYIFAFSFGFCWKQDVYGGKQPGPINEQFATKVLGYYLTKRRQIYAQWEISSLLDGIVPRRDLCPIFPDVVESSAEKYLSTEDALQKMVKRLKKDCAAKDTPSNGGMKPKKVILIVAHRYHLPRCKYLADRDDFIQSSFTVVTDQDRMPYEYDEECAQRWITEPVRGIISEIISRLAAFRKKEPYKLTGITSDLISYLENHRKELYI